MVGDELAIILTGDGLDQDRLRPVRCGTVVDHFGTGFPVEREVAHALTQEGMVLPGLCRDIGIRKPGLM